MINSINLLTEKCEGASLNFRNYHWNLLFQWIQLSFHGQGNCDFLPFWNPAISFSFALQCVTVFITHSLVDPAPTCRQCLALSGRSWCTAVGATDGWHCRKWGTCCSPPGVWRDSSCRLQWRVQMQLGSGEGEVGQSRRFVRRRNLHVWRHSVTVVASMKYPLHILHVMWLFMLFSLIFLSISDQFTENEWAEKRNEGNTWTCSELRVALPVDFVRNQECSPTIEPLWGKCWCPLGCRQSQGTTRNVWEGGLFTLPIRTRRLFCNYLGQRGINSILTMTIHWSIVVTWNTTEMYTNW